VVTLTEPARGGFPHESAHRRRAPHALGVTGEEFARQYLEGIGLVVLSRNWRCREGELDLVATDGRTLVVCEVKTRSGAGFGDPAEAVTAEKAARIRRLTSRWLAEHRMRWCPIRYDVIAVVAPRGNVPRLKHHRGAF
jgi:putative endonuclease